MLQGISKRRKEGGEGLAGSGQRAAAAVWQHDYCASPLLPLQNH